MLTNLFKTSNEELTFIITRLKDHGALEYFNQEKFARFRSLINGPKATAAKEYQTVTGANLSECIVAINIAKKIIK